MELVMNIALWVVQILLAAHTVIGAIWKFSNSEQAVPSLSALPHSVWLGLSGIELLCALGLVLPAISKGFSGLVPVAAIVIAAEMLLFCGLHLASGDPNHGQMIYWLVVAAVCAFVAYGRLVLKPL
jgi:hypothetical protein